MCNPVGEAPLSSTPLLEALLRHREKGRVSFHTPGHKGKDSLLAPLLSLELDLTELPDTGSLYDGGDAIEQSEPPGGLRLWGGPDTVQCPAAVPCASRRCCCWGPGREAGCSWPAIPTAAR